jgi:ABC-type dipeptide/oligopeptide/nickel transport system ATPase component
MDRLLDIRSLSIDYLNGEHVTPAVDNVDLYVSEGEVVGLLGESGSGKSTLALSIMKLLDPSVGLAGSIKWMGKEIMSMSQKELLPIRGKEVAYVFQDPYSSLNPVLTIADQMTEIMIYHENMSKPDALERSIELLKSVHIPDAAGRINDYPHQFSGGMRQRVAIAMACALRPKLIIADEPTSSLDVTVQKNIMDLLKEQKTTMLFITHNIALVKDFCSRAYVMKKGKMLEEGSPEELINDPKNIYTVQLINAFKEVNGGINRG